ncbi:hypothetical protein CHS0354_011626 [Potamilus streckersoni]|uniref:Uncharacterized protein n=1 Tax=Potamilus streckersoni TaxID=2493646 RepID=A0AAE0WFE1_9BIVA|nr:hypothetical protein CHS0354_011626 [Potamilus streckersoni]
MTNNLPMAPVAGRSIPTDLHISSWCTAATSNSTTNSQQSDSDIHAVFYIVVTLVFYSIGIVIGIITYLKREKREIEEDKMYDEYISFRKGYGSPTRSLKVQQVIARLQEIHESKLGQIDLVHKERALQSVDSRTDSACRSVRLVENKGVIEFGSTQQDTTHQCDKMANKLQESLVDIYESDEEIFSNKRLSTIVAKIFEGDEDKEYLYSGDDVNPDKDNVDKRPGTEGKPNSFREDSEFDTCTILEYKEEPRRSKISNEDTEHEDKESLQDDKETKRLPPAETEPKHHQTVHGRWSVTSV